MQCTDIIKVVIYQHKKQNEQALSQHGGTVLLIRSDTPGWPHPFSEVTPNTESAMHEVASLATAVLQPEMLAGNGQQLPLCCFCYTQNEVLLNSTSILRRLEVINTCTIEAVAAISFVCCCQPAPMQVIIHEWFLQHSQQHTAKVLCKCLSQHELHHSQAQLFSPAHLAPIVACLGREGTSCAGMSNFITPNSDA